MAQYCVVCGEPARNQNFGVISCPACCAFFRRTIRLRRSYACPRDGQCVINGQTVPKCSACRLRKCHAVGMQANAVQWFRDAIGRSSGVQGDSDTESQTSSTSEKAINNVRCVFPPSSIIDTLKVTYSTLNYRRKLFYAKTDLLSLFDDDKLEYSELGHYSEGLLQLCFTEPRFCSSIINESVELKAISNTDKGHVFTTFTRHLQSLEDLYFSWKFGCSKEGHFWVLPNKKYLNVEKMESYFTHDDDPTKTKKKHTIFRVYMKISLRLIEIMEVYMKSVIPNDNDFIFLFGLLLYDPTIPNITDNTRLILQRCQNILIKEFFMLCKLKSDAPEIRFAEISMLMTGIKYYEQRLCEEMRTLRNSDVIPLDNRFDEVWNVKRFKR